MTNTTDTLNLRPAPFEVAEDMSHVHLSSAEMVLALKMLDQSGLPQNIPPFLAQIAFAEVVEALLDAEKEGLIVRHRNDEDEVVYEYPDVPEDSETEQRFVNLHQKFAEDIVALEAAAKHIEALEALEADLSSE